MATRWFFGAKDGTQSLSQVGENIFFPNGPHMYFENGGWWFEVDGGKAAFYLQDNWVFSADGNPAYFRSE